MRIKNICNKKKKILLKKDHQFNRKNISNEIK